uniref:Uncharacterized protein n=1 Tax=Uncultured archaeon GZfos26G2 TaxID=3386331 RepID=Q648H6_UNCAG|nr:hypothetical protein GZ37D1_48 [uncultured archaeon GZfos37D1]
MMRSNTLKRLVYTLFICLLVFTSALSTTAGQNLDISTSFSLEGEGVTYRVLEAESEDGLNGLKFTEEWITPGLGYHGNTTIKYEEFFFFSTNNASYISVEAATTYTNLDYLTCSKNYILGAAQGHKNRGNSTISLMYQADNMTSVIMADGLISGKTTFSFMAIDHANNTRLYKDKITHIGSANLNLENVIMLPDYPAAGEDDWLPCP